MKNIVKISLFIIILFIFLSSGVFAKDNYYIKWIKKEFIINNNGNLENSSPDAVLLNNGNIFIVWESAKDSNTRPQLWGKIIDANGNTIKKDFKVANDNFIQEPYVELLDNGNVFIVWASYDKNGKDKEGFHIEGKILKENGDTVKEKFQINDYSKGSQYKPRIAILNNGNIQIFWKNQIGKMIGTKIFDGNGNVVNNETFINEFSYSSKRNWLDKQTIMPNGEIYKIYSTRIKYNCEKTRGCYALNISYKGGVKEVKLNTEENELGKNKFIYLGDNTIFAYYYVYSYDKNKNEKTNIEGSILKLKNITEELKEKYKKWSAIKPLPAENITDSCVTLSAHVEKQIGYKDDHYVQFVIYDSDNEKEILSGQKIIISKNGKIERTYCNLKPNHKYYFWAYGTAFGVDPKNRLSFITKKENTFFKNGKWITHTEDCQTFFHDSHMIGTEGAVKGTSTCSCESGFKLNSTKNKCIRKDGTWTSTPSADADNPNVSKDKLKGQKCSSDLIMTQNLRAPRWGYIRNGRYDWYTKGIVREAHILQQHLNRLGFNAGPVDGIIGPKTRGAILRLQRYLGTTPDGYVGPKTRALLNNSCDGSGLVQEKLID